MAEKILITSALPYVNNVPHLGNIVGCVLSADVFARFCRARGKETLFICGTDEHGTATETKALEEGLTPKEICDKYYAIHKKVYEWFDCSFDAFGRTSTETHHEITQSIFKRLHANGYIKEGDVEQLYCPQCDKYLADRFVEGTCPYCGDTGARGDQCDKCGKLLNAVELINSRCKVCSSKPQVRSTRHLFLDLPKLSPELQKWSEESASAGAWTQNAKTVTTAWFKEGLKDRAISRDLKWGVPIPLEGYTDKVFYVWFDAPIGYISITKHAFPDSWERWWKGDGVKLYQFMAKDNIPFHTIIFPASLIGARDDWTLLHHIDSTEYLNYEDGKFSKSLGSGVFGDDVIGTGIPVDVWRYYLISTRPEGSDTHFNWNEFQEKNNNELLANLGNFVNRTLTFTSKYFNGSVPGTLLTDADDALISSVNEHIKNYIDLFEAVKEREALREVMNISRTGNQYFQENAPWKLMKEEAGADGLKRCGTVLNMCCNLVKTLAVLVRPFLPNTSEAIFSQLGVDPISEIGYKMHLDLGKGHKLGEAKVLFRKIETKEIIAFREKFGGKKKAVKKEEVLEKFEKFPAQLKVAKVLSVEDHPDASKLYVLKIDLGSEERQLVAGLKAHLPKDAVLGKKIIVVCNLKPAKLRGVESQGMLLAADDGKKVALLEAPESDIGDEVSVEGVADVDPFRELTIDEFFKLQLSVNSEGNIVCRNFGKKLKTPVEYVSVKGVVEGAKVR